MGLAAEAPFHGGGKGCRSGSAGVVSLFKSFSTAAQQARSPSETINVQAQELRILGCSTAAVKEMQFLPSCFKDSKRCDLMEVEAYVRIAKLSDRLQSAVIEALRDGPKVGDEGTQFASGEAVVAQGVMLDPDVFQALQQMDAILERARLALFGGEDVTGVFQSADGGEDTVARIVDWAQIRREMRVACGQLRKGLEADPRTEATSAPIRKYFDKLRALCYDHGTPRPDGAPGPAEIPNFMGVLRELEGSPDLLGIIPAAGPVQEGLDKFAFWIGGQPDQDGVDWLVAQGFRAFVDLRGTDKSNMWMPPHLPTSAKIRRFAVPMNKGHLPCDEAFSVFLDLVEDQRNHPMFVFSNLGLQRTAVMVTRWRQYCSVEEGGQSCTGEFLVVPEAYDEPVKMQSGLLEGQVAENGIIVESLHGGDSAGTYGHGTGNGIHDTSNGGMNGQSCPWPRDVMALQTPDVVLQRLSKVAQSADSDKLPATASPWERQRPRYKGQGTREAVRVVAKLSTQSSNGVSKTNENGVESGKGELATQETARKMGPVKSSLEASIVRLQSQKKAEIFLVRTDGFTCTKERVRGSQLTFSHPSNQQQMLMWKTRPQTVLLLTKLGDELQPKTEEVAMWLHREEGMTVVVEPHVHDVLARVPGFGFVETFFPEQEQQDLHERIDVVVCLGGDGVILHASNLFASAVPPVLSFNLGSLGFLTSHQYNDYKHDLREVIYGDEFTDGVYITLRMRLRCEIYRHGRLIPGRTFEVLNEVVVDRGSSPYLSKIECYERGRLITKVQADGVMLATPTGSTAYSVAAGGSMVHPNVACILFTPICPHSLSFRPVILPDSADIELKVPDDARSTAWVCFDGKKRQQLMRGDSVRVRMSEHPMPTINKKDQTDDWFRSLGRCLNWNERLEQRPLMMK
eukprot:jgi/Chlat1/8961/Chrsp94S08332